MSVSTSSRYFSRIYLTKSEIMLLTRIRLFDQKRIRNVVDLFNNHRYRVRFSNVAANETLPKLPVPKLEQTLEKYFQSVQPFLQNQDEIKRTCNAIDDFRQNGRQLQELLEERARNYDNWLSDWWLETAYLAYRDPVVIYSSPGLVFPHQDFQQDPDKQFEYAARLILAALNYKKLIDSGCMPTERFGKDPLDMNQYNKIFGTCRIPGVKIDHLEFNPQSTHIVVVKNNNFFKVNTTESSVCQLINCLKEISKQSEETGVPVGILTADDRNSWGRSYQDLTLSLSSHNYFRFQLIRIILDPNNLRSVREIQTSLFLVCLDQSSTKTANSQRSNDSKQTIHGGGSSANSANRWYDKTVQFIISDNGTVGLTYEHSPSEGQPIAVMTDYLINSIEKNINNDGKSSEIIPEKLEFQIDDKIQQGIDHAKQTVDKLVENFDMNAFQFEQYGKEFVKSQKLSPDSFIQIAIQSAFYRLHCVPGAHYESASTRKFIHGRTETIRSCSNESINFAKILINNNKTNCEKLVALKAAIAAHKNYTIDALNGSGVDRHLLGLKLIAIENCLPLPDLYKDASYLRSTHMRLSTSQVATKCDAWMCYGPLTHDGYGCCYNPRSDDVNFAVSAWLDNPETDTKQFREALEDSLCEMQQILATNQKSKL